MVKTTPAIILSAGYSRRLGKPKALVEVSGKTLLEHAINKLQFAGCNPIIIVVNQELQYDALLLSNGSTIVVNKDPDKGRTGSLKVGLQSLQIEFGRVPNKVIMCPVDRPGWKASHIKQLLAQVESSCLADGERNGHPVSIVKNDLEAVIMANDDKPLKEIVTFEPVTVSNSLLSLNIDTEADKLKLNQNAEFFSKL